MLNMRESWTDERLDDFAKHVDHRFDEVDRRLDKVDTELNRVNDRLDGLHHAVIHAIIAMTVAILAGYAVLGALIVTQL